MLGVDSESRSHAALRIGEWLVVPDVNRIGRGSEVVRLEPKAMSVLLHLAQRRGAVVTREELLTAVWPRVIVGDNALTQVIIKLRRALGDSAHEPRYIEAISKKGYRLIASIGQAVAPLPVPETDRRLTPAAFAPRPASAGSVSTAPSPDRMHARRRWLMSVTLLVVTLTVAGLFEWRRHDTARLREAGLVGEMSAVDALPMLRVESFEATGPDPRLTLIARGVSADLATDLSKVSGLRVATGAEPPSLPAAETTRARYVLSGSVIGDGERLRVYAYLVDAIAGRELWSQRFDRDASDLFAVQDDLVHSILAVLSVKVTDAETLRIAQRDTRNLRAYEQFLRGQAALLVRSRSQNEAARAEYWRAIRLDPAFARAYAGLALADALDYQMGWASDGRAALGRALELARSAEQMRPDIAETHWVLGFVDVQRREHGEALRHLDTALRLNPSYADAYALKGGIDTYVGRPRDGISLLRTAMRLNPQAGSLYFLLLGRAYYFLGDSAQARVNLEQALLRNPENLEAHIYLTAVDRALGMDGAAQWEVTEIRALDPGFDAGRWLAPYPLTDARQRERLASALREVGL